MAWQIYGWAWNIVGIQGSEYVVLLFLANEADVHGKVKMLKVQRIMSRCNISRASAFELLKKLERKGFIKRISQWKFDGSQAASSFELNLKRWFPLGTYNESLELWQQILKCVEGFSGARISPVDLRDLRRVQEAWYQKNARTLWLVTDVDIYEDTLRRNIACFKEAVVLLKLPVRRFEVFRRPYFRDSH